MVEVLVAHHGGAVCEAILVEVLGVHRRAHVECDRPVAGQHVLAVPLVELAQLEVCRVGDVGRGLVQENPVADPRKELRVVRVVVAKNGVVAEEVGE